MSDPLPGPSFNPTYSVQPTDLGSGYAAGIKQAGGDGESSGAAAIAADAKRTDTRAASFGDPNLTRSMPA
jgi:hypothetical protein